MSDFRFIVGQNVLIESKDRNLNGKTAKILTRHSTSWDDLDDGTDRNWYKVTGDGFHSLSFFETQLKEIK